MKQQMKKNNYILWVCMLSSYAVFATAYHGTVIEDLPFWERKAFIWPALIIGSLLVLYLAFKLVKAVNKKS